MQRLQHRVEGCKQRLAEQNQSVADIYRGALALQAQAAALKKTFDGMAPKLQAEIAGQGFAGGLLRCIPYLLIAAAGIGYGLTNCTVEAAAPMAAEVASLRLPSREALAAVSALAPGDPEREALGLVYEYRLPGTDEDMLDLVGAQEDALGPSPWEIECDESHRCDVSFIPRIGRGEEPLYEFAVDLGAQAVIPSTTTVERLRSDAAAQNAAG